MKRVLLLVAALFMVAGVAHAQICDMSRSEIVDAAVDVFNDWDDAGELEGWITENPFSADVAVWDEIAVDGFELSVIDSGLADEADSGCDWFFMLSSDGDASDDFHTGVWDTPTTTATAEGLWGMRLSEGAEWYLALVGCPDVEPPPPPISITGPGHRLLVDAALDLAVDAGDIEPTAYQWAKDGEDLGGETGAALSILSATTDDTGDYSCLVTYDDGGGDAAYAEAEPHYYVWVTEAGLPLAGGLGLGLLAGACALAGAVSIRRKK
jgi:hypothetical protein